MDIGCPMAENIMEMSASNFVLRGFLGVFFFTSVSCTSALNRGVADSARRPSSETSSGLPSSDPDCRILDSDLEPLDREHIERTARRTFEDRFSRISPDPRSQSAQNLNRIWSAFARKRSGFQALVEKAQSALNDIDAKLSVEHETHALLEILKEGAVLSRNELFRRGLVRGDQMDQYTKAESDGETGEQDVVFTAIRPSFMSEDTDLFGPYVITFDKEKILNAGYMTPFPFGWGMPEGRARGQITYQCGIPVYRQWIFTGVESYRKLLTLSIVQLLWERQQNFGPVRNELMALVRELDLHYSSHFVRLRDADVGEVPTLRRLQSLFSLLGQELPDSLLPSSGHAVWGVVDHWMTSDSKYKGRMDRLVNPLEDPFLTLEAYKGFPNTKNEMPPLILPSARFWELKVPREIPLAYATSIAIPNDCFELSPSPECKAIRDYAQRSGRKIKLSETRIRGSSFSVFTFLN